MTVSKFNKLKVGDTVTLAESRPEYFCGYNTLDGRAYVPSGTKGVVGVVKVPAVTRNRYFVCVDFPPNTPLIDSNNQPFNYTRSCEFRCAAYPEELV